MDGKNSQIRILELDAVRGIAALMVVLYHYTTWSTQSEGFSSTAPLFEFWQGKFGVYLFFIVSGFVIFLTLEKCDNISDFIVSRFARLYPAYWICVLITFLILYLTPIPGREVSTQQLLINMTMLQKFLRVASIDGVYWTLAVELVFYFYMGMYFIFRKIINIKLLSLCYLMVCAICACGQELEFIILPSEVRFLLLLDYGYFFVAGITFYLLTTENVDIT